MIAHARNMQSAAMESAQYSMKGPFTVSLLFHVVFFAFTFIGLPFIAKDPVIITPISVELVDIDELTQTNQRPPPKVEDKPKPIEKPKEPEPPKPPPEPEPEPEQVKEPDPVPKPEPEAEKPVEKPKPKPPKPKPPQEKPKEKPKEPERDINSLLKDLTPTEKEEAQKPRPDSVDPEEGQLADFANKMSMSELDALRSQIEPCWNFPAGAEYAEQLVVTLRLQMNRDASARDIDVIRDGGRYNRDPAFRAAADSAIRAVRNPRCSPFDLPPEKYDQWKTIVINFDPSAML